MSSEDRLRHRYALAGQERIVDALDQLPQDEQARLRGELEALDVEAWARGARAALGRGPARVAEPSPPSVLRLPERGGSSAARAEAGALGRLVLGAGRVAPLVVAGGQGSRLGHPGPKGTLPLGPVSGRTLFEIHAQRVRYFLGRTGTRVPWLVMTSRATHDATLAYLGVNAFFDLPEEAWIFEQGSLPSCDPDGRLLLAPPGCLARNPDGHGGLFQALADGGWLDRLEARGVETLSYIQVDNPLANPFDPVFVGEHRRRGAEMSLKVIEKQSADEPAGSVVDSPEGNRVLEYIEVDPDIREAREQDGSLRYWAASMGIHLIDISLIRRVVADLPRSLPWHASAKRIETRDEAAATLEPDAPNGYKLERFVFDALAEARGVTLLEARRHDEYAPVKSRAGSATAARARRALSSQARGWLREAGIRGVPPGSAIEIDLSRIGSAEDARELGVQDVAQAAEVIRTGGKEPA